MLFGIIAHFVATVGGDSIFPHSRTGLKNLSIQLFRTIEFKSNVKHTFFSLILAFFAFFRFRKPKTTVCSVLLLAARSVNWNFKTHNPTNQNRKRAKWWIGYRHCRYRAYRCRIHCRYRRRRISRINHHTPHSTRLICTPRICIRRHLSMRCTVPRVDQRQPRRQWPPLPTCIRMSAGCSMGRRTGMGELNSSIAGSAVGKVVQILKFVLPCTEQNWIRVLNSVVKNNFGSVAMLTDNLFPKLNFRMWCMIKMLLLFNSTSIETVVFEFGFLGFIN